MKKLLVLSVLLTSFYVEASIVEEVRCFAHDRWGKYPMKILRDRGQKILIYEDHTVIHFKAMVHRHDKEGHLMATILLADEKRITSIFPKPKNRYEEVELDYNGGWAITCEKR